LLLAGCATTRVSHEPLEPAAQEELLRGLPGFWFEGRAAARAGEQAHPTAGLKWIQQDAESRLQLSGLLGAGGLTLVYSPGSLLVRSGNGGSYENAEAEELIVSELGFVPPFEALRYWVLGLVAPGEPPASRQADAAGRVAEMTQLGWHISYERWAPQATRAGEVQLPQRLTATLADVQLRLVVYRWKLEAAD
jgi:outer membrane lipoprotein LolB